MRYPGWAAAQRLALGPRPRSRAHKTSVPIRCKACSDWVFSSSWLPLFGHGRHKPAKLFAWGGPNPSCSVTLLFFGWRSAQGV